MSELPYMLKDGVFSTKHDSKGNPSVYGNKGDKVRIISYHEDIIIVESIEGQRFPVKAENLIKPI